MYCALSSRGQQELIADRALTDLSSPGSWDLLHTILAFTYTTEDREP